MTSILMKTVLVLMVVSLTASAVPDAQGEASAAASPLQEIRLSREVGVGDADGTAPVPRGSRDMVFRPMFATRQREALRRQEEAAAKRRAAKRKAEKRRKRPAHPQRALHFPVSGAGAGEPAMALRVSVNDFDFQSAPANDLPAHGALRPMLLARLRAANPDDLHDDLNDTEAFLLMSTDGGKPAIVPAPGANTHTSLVRKLVAMSGVKPDKFDVKLKSKRKRGTSTQGHNRVTRDAKDFGVKLGDDLMSKTTDLRNRANIAERVRKYDSQGMFPSYSYTHGRYTRGVAEPQDPKPDAKEVMDTAEQAVFRPLFASRDRHAEKMRRAEAHRRRQTGVKPSPPQKKKRPGRNRPPTANPNAVRPVNRPRHPPTSNNRPSKPVPHIRLPSNRKSFHRPMYRARYHYMPYRRIYYTY